MSDIYKSSKFDVNPNILEAQVDGDQLLVLDPEKGEYFELNSTSNFILKLMKQGHDFDSIVNQLLREFDCSKQQATEDLNQLIVSFKNANVLL